MTDQGHWPFDSEADKKGLRAEDLKNPKGRQSNKAAYRQQIRNDRLIVGGRGHVKKSGLS